MDFDLTKEQKDIQRAVREFAEAEFTSELMLDIERNHRFPTELMKKASHLGFITIDFPQEYGGGGYGLMEKALVCQELCRVGAGVGVSIAASMFASKIVLRCGDPEQKRKYLPPVCSGEGLPVSGCFTEPDRGSDLVTFPLSVTAQKEGAEYIINGTKTFISFADIAKFAVVLCQTAAEAKPPYRGQSTIIVDNPAQQSGVSISVFEKMGWHASAATQVSFSNVRVPLSNLVGEEGRGFYNTIEFLDGYRVEVGASAVGLAQGAFERALTYAQNRSAFGHKIGTFQAISHKLAEMATKIEAVRLLVYEAAYQFDKEGKIDPKLSSMAKWFPARVAVEVADEAIEILGGHGYMLENEVERFYRDARHFELVEGTREIHKNTIARSLLGKLE
ncbi:MAG: acyl-CoA dehydrogenase (acd-7) [Chloroflexi bacterium]|nr:acyl-CoA dehydrogenase (acd-7) [Chloroflexota bacterium]